MLSKYMPPEFIVHGSGHDLIGFTSLYNYVDACRAIAIIPALVLAGWPALPWGRLGEGPKPASLNPLTDAGVSIEALDPVIDSLFHLDPASPPMLLVGGANRPMVQAAFASMLMYHGERRATGEVRDVLVELEKLLTLDQLDQWGALIRAKFDADNAHLKMGSITSEGAMANIIRALGRSLSQNQSEVRCLRHEIFALRTSLAAALATRAAPPSTPPATPTPTTTQAAAANEGEAINPPPAVSPMSPAGASASRGMGSLMPHVATGAEPRPELLEQTASLGDYYANLMARGGAIPSTLKDGDKGRAKLLLHWCNNLATDEEKLLLKPAKAGCVLPCQGARRTAAQNIENLMVARLLDYYDEGKAPRELGKGKLTASGFENRIRAIAKQNNLQVKAFTESAGKLSLLRQWRERHEEREAERAKAAQAESSSPAKRARHQPSWAPQAAQSAEE